MTPGRALTALGLAVLVIVWIALQPGPGDERAPQASPEPSASPVPSAVNAGLGETPSTPSKRPSTPADTSATPADEPDGLSPVEAYRRYAIHPPHSRPLDARQADLIDWNRRHESPRADPENPETTTLFTADRYHVVGAQTLSPVLDVRAHGEPVAVTVLDSRVRLPDGRAFPFELQARDGVRVGVVEPEAWGLEAAARIELQTSFDAGNGPRTARFFATYTPDGAVPARFGAVLGDTVVDGGLEVAVEVHVERAGLYLFDANLFAGGEPVAWTRAKPHFEPGTHRLVLRFFGKALHDRGLDGPYTVEQLRGALAVPGETPPTVQMAPFDGVIPTGAHSATDFSGAEWDSPRKRDRIARLKRLEAMGGPVVTTPAWQEEGRR